MFIGKHATFSNQIDYKHVIEFLFDIRIILSFVRNLVRFWNGTWSYGVYFHRLRYLLFCVNQRRYALIFNMKKKFYISIIERFFCYWFSGVTGDRVGLAITQSLTLTGLLQWGVRQRKYLNIDCGIKNNNIYCNANLFLCTTD